MQNFSSKASNLAKMQFFMPYFFQKINSLSPIFPKNHFFKPLFLVPTHSLSPHFRPFGPHTYTKMKVEYPPGFSLFASKGNPTHVQASILTLGPTRVWHALHLLHLYCAQLSAHFSISIYNVKRPANLGMIIVQLQLSGTVAAVESGFS